MPLLSHEGAVSRIKAMALGCVYQQSHCCNEGYNEKGDVESSGSSVFWFLNGTC